MEFKPISQALAARSIMLLLVVSILTKNVTTWYLAGLRHGTPKILSNEKLSTIRRLNCNFDVHRYKMNYYARTFYPCISRVIKWSLLVNVIIWNFPQLERIALSVRCVNLSQKNVGDRVHARILPPVFPNKTPCQFGCFNPSRVLYFEKKVW